MTQQIQKKMEMSNGSFLSTRSVFMIFDAGKKWVRSVFMITIIGKSIFYVDEGLLDRK